jgi:hypothetical protein
MDGKGVNLLLPAPGATLREPAPPASKAKTDQ